MKWRKKRPAKAGSIIKQTCSISGCTLPGLIQLAGESFCLTHTRRLLGGRHTLSTHLNCEAVTTGLRPVKGKTNTETITLSQ